MWTENYAAVRELPTYGRTTVVPRCGRQVSATDFLLVVSGKETGPWMRKRAKDSDTSAAAIWVAKLTKLINAETGYCGRDKHKK